MVLDRGGWHDLAWAWHGMIARRPCLQRTTPHQALARPGLHFESVGPLRSMHQSPAKIVGGAISSTTYLTYDLSCSRGQGAEIFVVAPSESRAPRREIDSA
ncbi:hypothetical protein MN608_01973 [Microdochium nivale]|nr:hypothetical protein MN608_01973 [Microdochium nivale]